MSPTLLPWFEEDKKLCFQSLKNPRFIITHLKELQSKVNHITERGESISALHPPFGTTSCSLKIPSVKFHRRLTSTVRNTIKSCIFTLSWILEVQVYLSYEPGERIEDSSTQLYLPVTIVRTCSGCVRESRQGVVLKSKKVKVTKGYQKRLRKTDALKHSRTQGQGCIAEHL